MSNEPVTMIRFDPPLPCLVYKPENNGPCGEPAEIGFISHLLTRTMPSGREIRLTPICPACAKAMAANYGVDAEPQP